MNFNMIVDDSNGARHIPCSLYSYIILFVLSNLNVGRDLHLKRVGLEIITVPAGQSMSKSVRCAHTKKYHNNLLL